MDHRILNLGLLANILNAKKFHCPNFGHIINGHRILPSYSLHKTIVAIDNIKI